MTVDFQIVVFLWQRHYGCSVCRLSGGDSSSSFLTPKQELLCWNEEFLPIQIGKGSGGGLGGGCLKMTLHTKKEFLLISTGALYEREPGAHAEHSCSLEHECSSCSKTVIVAGKFHGVDFLIDIALCPV